MTARNQSRRLIENEVQAFAYVDASSGTPVIQKQKNVSSITDSGVGDYIMNFNIDLPSGNFCLAGLTENSMGSANPRAVYEDGSVARNVSNCSIRVSATSSNTPLDQTFSFIVLGG